MKYALLLVPIFFSACTFFDRTNSYKLEFNADSGDIFIPDSNINVERVVFQLNKNKYLIKNKRLSGRYINKVNFINTDTNLFSIQDINWHVPEENERFMIWVHAKDKYGDKLVFFKAVVKSDFKGKFYIKNSRKGLDDIYYPPD